MAISTYKTFLMSKATSESTYAKLIDIVDYPDLESPPEGLDITTLSDGSYRQIPGIKPVDVYAFTCNYDSATYATIKAMEGTLYDFGVWFGGTVAGGVATPTGSEGKFNFQGYVVITVNGGGVNEVSRMTVSIYRTSEITNS